MRTTESEAGRIVFERSREPCSLSVAISTFGAHFAQMNIRFLVAGIALYTQTLQIRLGAMAFGTGHLVMIALEFKVAELVYFLAKLNCKGLNIVTRFAGWSVFSGMRIYMTIGARCGSKIFTGKWNCVVSLQVV